MGLTLLEISCLVVAASAVISGSFGVAPVCDFYISNNLPENFDVSSYRMESGNVSVATNSVVCDHPEYNTCMVLWQCDSNSDVNCTSRTPLIKGCWNGAGQPDCQRDLCIDNGNPNRSNHIVPNARFCCCTSHRCNEDFMFIYQPADEGTLPPTVKKPAQLSASQQVTTIVIVCVLLSLCVVAGVFICYRMWMWKSWQLSSRLKDEKAALLNATGPQPEFLCLPQPIDSLGDFDIDQTALLDCVGHGRYGTVWRAVDTTDSLKRAIAVKIYQLPSSQQTNAKIFLNECQIYSLPFMGENKNLLSFYGAREKLIDGQTFGHPAGVEDLESTVGGNLSVPRREGWLFLSLNSGWTLQEFLKGNTVSWVQFCSMGSSITSGISFLHSEIKRDGGRKPPIVHRDMSSVNVLVKPNKMSCVICDMGFALAIDISQLKTEDSNEASIAEVGTLRYLAPEVLEGALNLRDPEIALKNVDVYAMALVLWEVLSRCIDIHLLQDGSDVPEYQLPYQNYLDIRQNSLEQMQLCVCRKKVRPLLPTAVTNISQLKCVKEVIEECWDQDSEARLTALCAQERFQDMLTNKSGLILAILNAGRADLNSNGVDLQYVNHCGNNGMSRINPMSPWPSGDSTGTSGIGSMAGSTAGDGSFKDNTANSHSSYAPMSTPRLQPFQGLNLCNERNTISESSDESGIDNRITESPCVKVDPDALVSPHKGPIVCSPRAPRPFSFVAMPSNLQGDQNFTNNLLLPTPNLSNTDDTSTVSSIGSGGMGGNKRHSRSKSGRFLSWVFGKRGQPIEENGDLSDGLSLGSPKLRNFPQKVKNTNSTTNAANLHAAQILSERKSENISSGGSSELPTGSQRKRSRSLENFITAQQAESRLGLSGVDEETVVVVVEPLPTDSVGQTGDN